MNIHCLFVKTSLRAKTIHIKNKFRLQVQVHANESHFHKFRLILKQRHKGLGNELLSTTKGKDGVPQERCLLIVQILTDSS